MKKLLFVVIISMLTPLFVCASDEEHIGEIVFAAQDENTLQEEAPFQNATVIKTGLLRGFSGVALVQFMNQEKDSERFKFVFFDDVELMAEELLSGKIDSCVLSSFSAYKLQEAAPNTVNVYASLSTADFALVGTAPGKISLESVKKQEVWISGHGFAESFFKYLLSETFDDGLGGITIQYEKSQKSLMKKLFSGECSYAVFSEPYISAVCRRTNRFFIKTDFQEEYEVINGKGKRLPLTVLVVRKDFSETRPLDFLEYTSAVEYSVQFAAENPRKTAALYKKSPLGQSALYSDYAIYNSHFSFRVLQ